MPFRSGSWFDPLRLEVALGQNAVLRGNHRQLVRVGKNLLHQRIVEPAVEKLRRVGEVFVDDWDAVMLRESVRHCVFVLSIDVVPVWLFGSWVPMLLEKNFSAHHNGITFVPMNVTHHRQVGNLRAL